MRLKFWRWTHDAAEWLWHWIYYERLLPLENKRRVPCRWEPGTDSNGKLLLDGYTPQPAEWDERP